MGVLDNLIIGRVEPHVYALQQALFQIILKVGDI